MVAPDDTTYSYMKGRPHAPQALGGGAWTTGAPFPSDEGATFDSEVEIDAGLRSNRTSRGEPIPPRPRR